MLNPHALLTTAGELDDLCRALGRAEVVAFDTEFISENRYRPELCLIQVCYDGSLALVDALALESTARFWEVVVDGPAVPVTHAARAELMFCHEATGRMPHRLFDVQVAAGLAGYEYPASYANLVGRLTRDELRKSETRSDWRRRPLTPEQLQYALQDVQYLPDMYRRLERELQSLGRADALREEMVENQKLLWQQEVDQPWSRLASSQGLRPRGQAVLIELWKWRDRKAARKNIPARRVLRDDLLVELARRETAKPQSIATLRGMIRNDLDLQEIAAAIQLGLTMAPPALPPSGNPRTLDEYGLLGQHLYTAFGLVCREHRVAPALAGSVQDVRKLAAWYLGEQAPEGPLPKLLSGWRRHVVGEFIEEVMDGKWAISVDRNNLDHPLKLQRINRADIPEGV